MNRQGYGEITSSSSAPSDDERVRIALARAKDRFPDHRPDIAFPVCLPVYELRLQVAVMAKDDLSVTSRFIMRLLNLGVSDPAEIRRYLGLASGYVSAAAAEMLSASLIIQRPNLGIEMTPKGEEALLDGGRIQRPANRYPHVPYDPLIGRMVDIGRDDLLKRDAVFKNGLFIVPSSPRKPRLGQVRLEEVERVTREDYRFRDVDILRIVAIKDANLRYRDDVVLVKLDSTNATVPAFAAYRDYEYLSEESAQIQQLADKGVDLTPEDLKASEASPPIYSTSATREEARLLIDIDRLDREIGDIDQESQDVRETQGTTRNADERAALAARVRELEAAKLELESRLSEKESELREATSGDFRLIRTEEHRHYLLKAIEEADSEITLVSAWIGPDAFDDEVCRLLADAINRRGVKVRIAWGMGVRRRGYEAKRNREKGENALKPLRRMVLGSLKSRLDIKLAETHEKFIICDDKFCAWGSLNWLSYRGMRGSGSRRETSSYSSRPEDVAKWRENAEYLFR